MNRIEFRDYEYAIHGKPGVPVWLRSVGHFLLKKADTSSWNEKSTFCELFWCIEGKGIFEFNGKSYTVSPNEVWYYPEGARHCFRPADNLFHYRWFTLEGPMAPALFASVGLIPGIRYGGKCPEDLFAQLELLIRQSSPAACLQQLAAGFQILCLAASGIKLKKMKRNYVQEACAILEQDFANPDLNIKSLAMILHVSRVQLSRDFSHQFGIPISAYLRNLRVQKGMDLLKDSAMNVEEISGACGYHSPNYFGKVVTGLTGQNPTKHRNLISGSRKHRVRRRKKQ